MRQLQRRSGTSTARSAWRPTTWPAAPAGPLWGHTRFYSNRFPNNNSYGNGCRWFVRQWPLLVHEGSAIMVLFEPTEAYWFDPGPGRLCRPLRRKQTLVHDTTNHVYRMTDPDGTVWEFFEFSQDSNTPTTLPDGLFKQRITPGGQTATVTQCTATQILQVQSPTPARARPSSNTTTATSAAASTTANWPRSPSAAPGRLQLPGRRPPGQLYLLRPGRPQRPAQRPENRHLPDLDTNGNPSAPATPITIATTWTAPAAWASPTA